MNKLELNHRFENFILTWDAVPAPKAAAVPAPKAAAVPAPKAAGGLSGVTAHGRPPWQELTSEEENAQGVAVLTGRMHARRGEPRWQLGRGQGWG
jgi:hypothetical protein